jgi:hypothetical protein
MIPTSVHRHRCDVRWLGTARHLTWLAARGSRLQRRGSDPKGAALRTLEAEETADRMRWLSGDTWPPSSGYTGFDATGPWPAAAWVLNAIYERDDMPADLTHHELHHQAIAAGLRQPTIINGVDVDEKSIVTGGDLGFAEKPPPPWRRLTWSELGAREGFDVWAVEREENELRFRPQADWEDPTVMPAAAWPAVGPTEQLSWPVSLLPPTEGSLDAESLEVLIAVLTPHTAAQALADCAFYYGAVAFMRDGATVFAGDLRDLPTLVRSARGQQLTPNNIWPGDRSWLIYTDYDLNATRISGSPELIEALCKHQDLDTMQCDRPM